MLLLRFTVNVRLERLYSFGNEENDSENEGFDSENEENHLTIQENHLANKENHLEKENDLENDLPYFGYRLPTFGMENEEYELPIQEEEKK